MISKRTGKQHMCVDIQGLLNTKKKLTGIMNHPKYEYPMSDKECREYLKLYLFEGKRVLPMGDCDNFDFQTGCRGHDVTLLVHDWEFEDEVVS